MFTSQALGHHSFPLSMTADYKQGSCRPSPAGAGLVLRGCSGGGPAAAADSTACTLRVSPGWWVGRNQPSQHHLESTQVVPTLRMHLPQSGKAMPGWGSWPEGEGWWCKNCRWGGVRAEEWGLIPQRGTGRLGQAGGGRGLCPVLLALGPDGLLGMVRPPVLCQSLETNHHGWWCWDRKGPGRMSPLWSPHSPHQGVTTSRKNHLRASWLLLHRNPT